MMADRTALPYVLVHGFADDAETWRPLVPYLKDCRVHAWDLPGHGQRGQSPAQPPATRDTAIAEITERVADLGEPVTLVGHSLGGYLALKFTIDRPEMVASLVLISSGPGFRKADARSNWNEYIDSIAAKSSVPPAVTALAYQPDSFVIDHLTEVRCPLVHVIGACDRRYRAGAEYLRTVLPNSTLIEVEGAGHHPQRTHPDQVAAAIAAGRATLTRHPA